LPWFISPFENFNNLGAAHAGYLRVTNDPSAALNVRINISALHHITNPPQPHPSAGEGLPPPLGGERNQHTLQCGFWLIGAQVVPIEFLRLAWLGVSMKTASTD
jgi:hypothetical protein